MARVSRGVTARAKHKKVNKKAKFIEVKQGPYDEQNDKRRF